MGESFFSLVIFQLDTRGSFFSVRRISHWNYLPREAEDSSTLDTFKINLKGPGLSCPRKVRPNDS